MRPDGSWAACANTGDNTGASVGPNYTRGNQFTSGDSSYYYPNLQVQAGLTDAYGGDRILAPITIHETSPGSQTYGALQGAYRCQDVGIGSEDIISIAGTNYMAIQNGYRADFVDYWAMELT